MSDLLLGTPNPNYDHTIATQEFNLDFSSDLQFDSLGHLRIIQDESKLTQDVGKILLTEQGNNLFLDTYGTILSSFVGSTIIDDTVFALIKQTVLDAIGLLIGIQQDNTNSKEKIASIESIGVIFNDDGSGRVVVELDIVTEASKSITTSIILPVLG